MLIKEKTPILSGEITDKAIFINRRKIIKAAAGISIASLLPGSVNAQEKICAYSSWALLSLAKSHRLRRCSQLHQLL